MSMRLVSSFFWYTVLLYAFGWIQGKSDHSGSLQAKLSCNSVGQLPLQQAAMYLMEEVIERLFVYLLTSLLAVLWYNDTMQVILHVLKRWWELD